MFRKSLFSKKFVDSFIKVTNDACGWPALFSAWDINNGFCYKFAIALADYLENEKITYHTCKCHAYIKVGKYYYDAETPRGSTDVLCMHPERCDHQGGTREVSRQEFISYWAKNGRSGPVDHAVIRQVIGCYNAIKSA